jgi:hypothetical protein
VQFSVRVTRCFFAKKKLPNCNPTHVKNEYIACYAEKNWPGLCATSLLYVKSTQRKQPPKRRIFAQIWSPCFQYRHFLPRNPVFYFPYIGTCVSQICTYFCWAKLRHRMHLSTPPPPPKTSDLQLGIAQQKFLLPPLSLLCTAQHEIKSIYAQWSNHFSISQLSSFAQPQSKCLLLFSFYFDFS